MHRRALLRTGAGLATGVAVAGCATLGILGCPRRESARIEAVPANPTADYRTYVAPVVFEELPPAEAAIARAAIADEHRECSPLSDALGSFVRRAERRRGEQETAYRRETGEEPPFYLGVYYLRRGTTYYGLDMQVLDTYY